MPIVDVALSLDIVDVKLCEVDGFEGMLLTDPARSRGGIIANTSRGMRRARFTVAHELGHFLIERHLPTTDGGFACRSGDMSERRLATRHQRQESEANRFAIAMLAPERLVRSYLMRDPDIAEAQAIGRALEISLEASVRRYVELHDEPLAAVWHRDGVIRYAAWNNRFPTLSRRRGDRLSKETRASRGAAKGRQGRTSMAETIAGAWLLEPDVELFEQTRVGANGYAVTLLWATLPESGEEDEDNERLSPLSSPTFARR